MCATAQVWRSGDNLEFQAPLSTLFEPGSLCYLCCVHSDYVVGILLSVSHLTVGAEYRCGLPHLALHASWGFEHRSSCLHSTETPPLYQTLLSTSWLRNNGP